jgi:hypothetical protein
VHILPSDHNFGFCQRGADARRGIKYSDASTNNNTFRQIIFIFELLSHSSYQFKFPLHIHIFHLARVKLPAFIRIIKILFFRLYVLSVLLLQYSSPAELSLRSTVVAAALIGLGGDYAHTRPASTTLAKLLHTNTVVFF